MAELGGFKSLFVFTFRLSQEDLGSFAHHASITITGGGVRRNFGPLHTMRQSPSLVAESGGTWVLCTPCGDHHHWWRNLSEHITEVKKNVRNARCDRPFQVDCVLIFRNCMSFAKITSYWLVRLLNETLCTATLHSRIWALHGLREPGCRLESWRT
jgi:hypothetical protein